MSTTSDPLGPAIPSSSVASPESRPLVRKPVLWISYILPIMPSLMMVSGAIFAFLRTPQVVEGMAKEGYPAHLAPVIGALELLCVLLYWVPRTSVLGAILLTAYFGGAVATHLRIGEAQLVVPIIAAIFFWLGLYLREPRLHTLVPLRK